MRRSVHCCLLHTLSLKLVHTNFKRTWEEEKKTKEERGGGRGGGFRGRVEHFHVLTLTSCHSRNSTQVTEWWCWCWSCPGEESLPFALFWWCEDLQTLQLTHQTSETMALLPRKRLRTGASCCSHISQQPQALTLHGIRDRQDRRFPPKSLNHLWYPVSCLNHLYNISTSDCAYF